MTSSSGAEVWRIDPSDGSLYVVTKRWPDLADSLRPAGGRPSPRQLKVEVTAAELLPAITGIRTRYRWPVQKHSHIQVCSFRVDVARAVA